MANEITIDTTSEIVAAYNDELAVDQTIPIRRRLERLSGIVVTDDPATIEAAKEAKKHLNALLRDASASRMRIQRILKKHPIGRYAFTVSDLEKNIKAAANHLEMEIKAHEISAETAGLRYDVQRWACVIEAKLDRINRLIVELNQEGIHVENRGLFVEGEGV